MKSSNHHSDTLRSTEKHLVDELKSKFNKKRTIIFNDSKPPEPNLDNYNLSDSDHTSVSLNQFNYADFLAGVLPQHIRPKITLIAAYDKNYGIGKNGSLPWHIPEDLQWFKENTSGKPVIMGRTNFDDIHNITKGKGLPKRRNIVLSRTHQEVENFEFFTSVENILNSLKDEKEIVIIGGTMIYETFLPIADEIIITEIDKEYDTDVKFPQFKNQFICISNTKETASKKEQVDLYFKKYVRKEPPSMTGVSYINNKSVPYDYRNTEFISKKFRHKDKDIFFFDALIHIFLG